MTEHLHERLIALINEANDAERIREVLDPRHKFLETEIMEKLLKVKQSYEGQRFTDIEQVCEVLADEQLFDQIVQSLEQAPWTSHPMLLLPLRLETRFKANKLIVRIYPDQVFVNTHEEEVTEVEYRAAEEFSSAPDHKKRDAWRILSSQVGPLRAAWLARWADNHDFTDTRPSFRLASWTQAPGLVCLPDLFWVFAYRGNSLVYMRPSNPVRADSTILAPPFTSVQLRLYGTPGTWIKAGKQVKHNPNGTIWTIAETVVIGVRRSVDVSAKGGFLVTATRTRDWSIETPVIGWKSVQSLADSISVEGVFDSRSKWMHDLGTAIKDGFAVEFNDLSEEDLEKGFDRLIAVGVKWASAAQGKELVECMFDNHHYTGGLGFVASDTPTNNTAEVKSPYSSQEDHESAYKIEIEGPLNWETQAQGERRTNAHRLAHALGIDPERLRYVQSSGSTADSYADAMNHVIWLVTGDYYLRYLVPKALDAQQLDHLRKHVRDFVRGGGPLPTIRIKRQPYGVLPVSRIKSAQDIQNGWNPWHPQDPKKGDWDIQDGWAPWDSDADSLPASDQAFHRVTSRFHRLWLDYTDESWRVPRVGVPEADPDETLLRILSMEPRTVNFHARPFYDEQLIALLLTLLRDYAFGAGTAYEELGLSPLEWMYMWSDAWKQMRGHIARLFAELGVNAEVLDEPLLKILAWGEGEDNPVGMVYEQANGSNCSVAYLSDLCENENTKAETLLAEMGERAILLANTLDDSTIHDALCQLSSSSVLRFFNTVDNPEQIVQRIKDDPEHDASRDSEPPCAYGVRPDLARSILERRNELGGRFKSLSEIAAIEGVGPDTLHDIEYSFRDSEEQPDIDRLFRESLDLASHRVDAWVTSFATRRLFGIRARESSKIGIHLGAYGFVENLKPRDEKLSEGYIHAPSTSQAAAAAVLYNAFLTHDPKATRDGNEDHRTANPFHINLTSDRVRRALIIHEGIRQGQSLAAVLGYQLERALQDHDEPLEQYIDDFRDRFPLVAHKVTPAADDAPEPAEVVAARNVVDGAALVRDAREEKNKYRYVKTLFSDSTPPSDHIEALAKIIAILEDTLDAAGDLLITESAYQAVRGNFERSGAALEASAGNLAPPEPDFVTTPVPGRMFTHRVCLILNHTLNPVPNSDSGYPNDPRGAAEPRVAAWIESVFDNWEQIRIGFDFWEKELDADILCRVNVNTAGLKELEGLPGIKGVLANRIIEERCSERGQFKQIADLHRRVSGIGEDTIQELREVVTTGYVERVNVNTAPEEELATLPIIGSNSDVVDSLVAARKAEPFKRIDDLNRVTGIGPATVEKLRPHVTTGLEEIGLDEIGLSAADFLYIAQASPGGGATELEQRIVRIVRHEFSLLATQRIEVDARMSDNGAYSLENAVELAQQMLSLLAAGQPMSPDTMCHPGDIVDAGYTATDAEALHQRVQNAYSWVSNEDRTGILDAFNDVETISLVRLCLKGTEGTHIESGDMRVRHVPTGTVWAIAEDATIGADGTAQVMAETEAGLPIVVTGASDWSIETPTDGWNSVQSTGNSTVVEEHLEEVDNLLQKASTFGIPGAYPLALDDPQLLQRFENARAELDRRKAACERLLEKAKNIGNLNGQVRQLIEAMKALFGKSFICLPTFAPHQPEGKSNDLNDAFKQDILNGLGKDRLRLWMQQAAEVRPSIAALEDTLMLLEGWSQTTVSGNSPSLALKVAQLPFTEGRNWLGLSIEEGAEAEPNPGWTRSPLSLVAAVKGPLPIFANDAEGKNRVVTAGLVIDEWSELIPAGQVNTSVAFQYDAPSTQPPQSLLLAVPGQMKEIPGVWMSGELAAIVNDTIDLVKVRTVDMDALAKDPEPQEEKAQPKPIGGIIPGIYLPIEPDPDGWEKVVAVNSLQGWMDTLEEAPLGCISGYLDWPDGPSGQEFIDDGDQIWELIPRSEYDTDRFAPGLDNPLLQGAYVEVAGHIVEEEDPQRIFFRDYRVTSPVGRAHGYPDSFIPFACGGKAYWQGVVGASDLIFKCDGDGSEHLLLGRLALEVGRLPHSVEVRTVIEHLDFDQILNYNVITKIEGYKGPNTSDPVWVDSYSARAHCELTIPDAMLSDVEFYDVHIKIHVSIYIGEVEEQSNTFRLSGSSSDFVGSTYDKDRMQGHLGSKIWVVRQFEDNRSFVVADAVPHIGGPVFEYQEYEYAGPLFYIADFGLIREKDAFFSCE
jgi:DNA uptake protein ComE-like DNA-binding protein